MHKFPITQYKYFKELPLDLFNTFKYSLYVLDFDWNYLFVNDHAKNNLGERGKDLIGKNIWSEFPELAQESLFIKMRSDVEKGIVANFTIVSPVTRKRLHIVGYRLEDSFYFSSSVLPDKEDLINELRSHLGKK